MQRYRAGEDLDEYEDDFIEDDEDRYEDEEDEEEEEKEKPRSEEEIKYLNYREKLKAKHRSKLRSENGKNGVNISHSQLGNFGSFFGPSTPAIAERVIQESKSLLETRHLAPKVSSSQKDVKKVSLSSNTALKNGTSDRPLPKKVQSKAQVIKQIRDYSWLNSDNAEIPKPAKDPGPRKSEAPKPGLEDARSAQARAKRIETSSHLAKREYDGVDRRKLNSGISHTRDSRSAPSEKSTSGSRVSYPSSESKRQLDLRKQPQPNMQAGSSSGSGSRSAVQKTLLPKKPVSSGERKMHVGSSEKKPYGTPVGNKASAVAKTSTLDRQRLPVVKPQASGVNNRLEHARDVQRSTESKLLKKENVAASKSQIMRPPKQSSLQSNVERGHHLKRQNPVGQLQKSSAALKKDYKIKKRKSPEPEMDALSEIRKMFGYNPSRYRDFDDDDDDMMEVGFDAIRREEQRSARIAKQEDDEEWVKIQEEERRERMRKKMRNR